MAKKKTPAVGPGNGPRSDSAPVPDIQAEGANTPQAADSARPGSESGLFIDTVHDERKRHLLLLLSRDIPDIIPAPHAPEIEEGRYADGTPWKMLKAAKHTPLPPVRPKSVGELREWLERRRSRLLECDPSVLKVWPDTVTDLLDGARALGLTPPAMSLPIDSSDPQHLLGSLDAMSRWLDEVEAPPATENPPADVATAIDRYDLAILKALDDQSPRIMFQADIEAAASVPRRTIGKRLSALRDQGLICRPRGKRGETITDRGREIFQAAMKGHGK